MYISGSVSHWDDYRGKKAKAARDIGERALDKYLFNDQAFVFQNLWRGSQIAAGGGDLGEILTVASQVKDFDKQSWYTAWKGMADKVRASAEAAAAAGREVSAMQKFFRPRSTTGPPPSTSSATTRAGPSPGRTAGTAS